MRKRLAFLVLSVAVPAALAMGGLVGLNVLDARKSQENALLATARTLSMAVDMDLVADMATLEALAASDAVAARDWDRVRDRVERLALGPDAGVSVADRTGASLLNTVDSASAGLPTPHRHAPSRPGHARTASIAGRAVVSDLIDGAAASRPLVAIDAPAPTGDDGVVLSILFDPKRFLDLIQRQARPPDAMVTLVDGRRRVLARTRDAALYLGASATPAMIAAMDAAPEGVVPSRSLDGARTVVAYTRSPLSGWTTMVVTPRAAFEAPIWANLAGVGAIFLLLGGLSFVAVRRQSRAISSELPALERDANAVGLGQTVPRRSGRISGFDRVQSALSSASEELDRRDDRQKLLIHELNHRVKNTLATVQALAAQSFRGLDSEARGKFERRLVALGGAHDLLTQTTWTEIGIHDVVARCGGDQDPRISAAGPAALLPPEAAVALCMCVHELTTNSLKYGALARPEGRVAVAWASDGGEEIQFTWRETGGPPVQPPASEGFGTKLIDKLARHELNGSLRRDYARDGLVVTGRFRLPAGRRFRSDF